MKKFFKLVIIKILQVEARLILLRHKPKIIAVTGNVGKTSTKDAIHRVLAGGGFSVRKSEKSYNSADFGVALTILGCGSAWNDPLGWLEIIFYGLLQLFNRVPYPEWLVLEVGLEYPGEIRKVLTWLPVDYAVITLLPRVPVHIEFFSSLEEVLAEKVSVAEAVSATGKIFLNTEDELVWSYAQNFKGQIISFGQKAEALYRAGAGEVYYEETAGQNFPAGLEFKFSSPKQESLRARVPGVVGNHQIYPVLVALSVGAELGLSEEKMIETLADYLPPPGRLRLLAGIKETLILDDTYNASPAAMSAGLSTLSEFKTNGRKIAVLGDMLQLGNFTAEEHKKIGYQAKGVCNFVITVGLRSKFIHEALLERHFAKTHLQHFDKAEEAGLFLQAKLKAGDIIFIKGSQAIRLEKVVEEILAEPEKKADLLVRQSSEWKKI